MADIVQTKTLARNSDNTIDGETIYNELNYKAENLANDLVEFTEAAIDDIDVAAAARDAEAVAGEVARDATTTAGEASRDEAQVTREAALQAKADAVMTVNPDGTYYTKGTIDTLLSLPTVAEFEALAAKRRDEYAGSGFVEWGKHRNHTTSSYGEGVNEGLWAYSGGANVLRMGADPASLTYTEGVSKTKFPLVAINGSLSIVRNIQDVAGFNSIAMPDAPATSALLDRQDLVFLEVWHEDVSEKVFVYPYGNSQYGAASYECPDGTSLTCVNGSFSGYGTYSLFGNWQSSGDLVGKGIVWSTMTDAQKQSFCADPENNMYLDGDKVIQVRYRVRVIEGLGSDWEYGASPYFRCLYDASNQVRVKGSATSISADLGTAEDYFEGEYQDAPAYDASMGLGAWQGVAANWNNRTDKAHNGLCFALPIALVSRRNQGAFHNIFNSNGAGKCLNLDGTTSAFFYNTDRTYTSTEDSFTYKSGAGSIASAYTGRPDGLFYDAIYEHDVKDLRNSAHKIDFQRTEEREFNKAVAGETRGWEKGSRIVLANQNPTSDGTTSRVNYTGIENYAAIGDQIVIIQSGTPYKAFITNVATGYVDLDSMTFPVFASTTVTDTFVISGPRGASSK